RLICPRDRLVAKLPGNRVVELEYLNSQLRVGIGRQDVGDLRWRAGVDGQRCGRKHSSAGWRCVDLNGNIPAIIEYGGKSLVFPIGARNIWEPVGEQRNCRAIELPEGAYSIERFSWGSVQHRRLEQWLAGGGQDIAVLLAHPMGVDY